jgi:RHS repeat-associated protein
VENAGHRTSVTELSGRTVNYGYDSIYRLTSETIAGDPNAMNGAVSYVYDAVGNRTQKTLLRRAPSRARARTLPGYPGGLSNYNANDELASDTYDIEGNTTASQGLGYVYDFENHLVQAGAGTSFVYDGDGNRVQKTVAGVLKKYMIEGNNPTGYAQMLAEEAPNGYAHVTYMYGLELLSQNSDSAPARYYVHDGHGSVRALTDVNGTVTDTYDYDAFGNLIHSTGTSPNNYLFAGEQFDPDLNLYYNRARYLSTNSGRFWTMDSFEGNTQDPLSLHKYLYSDGDPVDFSDPTGRTVSNFVYGGKVHTELGLDFTEGSPNRFSNATINTILGATVPAGSLRPDLADRDTQEVYEIKPIDSAALGYPQLAGYLIVLNRYDPQKRTWVPGQTYFPKRVIELDPTAVAIVSPPAGGVIIYQVLSAVEISALVAIALKATFASLEAEIGLAVAVAVY